VTATIASAPAAGRASNRLLLATQVGFFVSGAAGLIYQIVWLRLLGTIFGSSTLAVSVDLTAFFGGLAIGSHLFGRLGDRWRRLFRAYGLMELGIAALCLASPFLLVLVRTIYLGAAHHLPFTSHWLLALQFGLCLLVLVPPTLLMGGTLPILSRAFTRDLSHLGRAVGGIYAINTFGAVLGVFLAGFILLPTIGLYQTIYLAVFGNTLVGILVLSFESAARRAQGMTFRAAAPAPTRSAPPPQAAPALLPTILLMAFGLSGLAGMTLEVAWTRALCLVIGSTIYAFTIILMAFLLGIALGSMLFARSWAHRRSGPQVFGAVLLAIGLFCALLSWVMGRLPLAFFKIVTAYMNTVSGYRDNYPLLLTVESLIVVALLIIPTMLMGMTFPILGRAYVTDERLVARGLGKAYASNTFGGIVGSFAAGFAFIPSIGVRSTILLACAVYLVVGFLVLIAASSRGRALAAGLAALVLGGLAIALLPGWEKELMSAGVYLGRSRVLEDYTAGRVIYYGDGSVCTVAVIREPSGELSLRLNGKPDASSTSEDLATQAGLANLPFLLAAHHDRALVIGLGSGITAGTLLDDGVKHLDVLEIEPHVLQAARLFAPYNYNVVNRPDAHILVGDGRNFVAATANQYDIITSEPSNVWVSGMSTLFTVEHFRACRAHLRPGGVMCQWLHLYAMGPRNLATIVKTFRQAFPGATLWSTYTGTNDALLIGRKSLARIDARGIERKMAANAALLRNLKTQGIDGVIEVLGALTAGPHALEVLARPGAINTDNRPLLEFTAPRYVYVYTLVDNVRRIEWLPREPLSHLVAFTPAQQASPEFQFGLGEAFARSYPPAFPWARAQFKAALKLHPKMILAQYDLAQVSRIQGEIEILQGRSDRGRRLLDEARRLLQPVLEADPNLYLGQYELARLTFDQAQVRASEGRSAEARRLFAEARRLAQQVVAAQPSFRPGRDLLVELESH